MTGLVEALDRHVVRRGGAVQTAPGIASKLQSVFPSYLKIIH
jgi:hypothetical protein